MGGLQATGMFHPLFGALAIGLELAGALIIVLGAAGATVAFLLAGRRHGWQKAVPGFRTSLGHAILLGLEFLVAADVIATITSPITAESLVLLGGLVLIRTLLSFALETEIEGRWPWQRGQGPKRERGS